jgi:glutathione peroxidase
MTKPRLSSGAASEGGVMRQAGGLLTALLLVVLSLVGVAMAQQPTRAFDFEFVSIDGKPMPLKTLEGRVLLVVNTASFCGFTPQYKGLQALSDAYEAKGLTVIGVPSNDFGAQEPKSEAEIKTFCEGAFGITFPLTEKAVVRGATAHPFYRWAESVLGTDAAPSWNFHKYLVGRDGKLIRAFGTRVEPGSKEVLAAIEAALASPAKAAVR